MMRLPPRSEPLTHTVLIGDARIAQPAASRTLTNSPAWTKLKPKPQRLPLPKNVTHSWIELRAEFRFVRGDIERSAVQMMNVVLALTCSKDGLNLYVIAQSEPVPIYDLRNPTKEALKALASIREKAAQHGFKEKPLPEGADWFSYHYRIR